MIKKLTDFLEKTLVPIAAKLSKLRPLAAISTGFTSLIPITIVGSIFTLLANLQIKPYQAFLSATKLNEIFSFVPRVTTDLISIYAVFLIAKAMAEKLDLDEKVATIVGAIALVTFFLLIPLGVSGTAEDGSIVAIGSALSTMYLGAPGLFTAIIIGLLVPSIYNLFVKYKIVFKMPQQVPEYISKSFSALIPAFAILFIFAIVRYLFGLTSYEHVNNFIYSVIRVPLSSLTASPLTFIILLIVCDILWFFGMHGGLIVYPFLSLLYTSLNLENLAAFEAGTVLPHAITGGTWTQYAMIGGSGATLGLCILMLFFAKSIHYKTLGKLAIPASACGINEPLLFGMPIVLNTIMIIPFVLAPVIAFLVSYVSTTIGLVPFQNGVAVPLGTPVIFSGFLTAGWRGALLQVVIIAVQVVIYYPFFKVSDKQALKLEKENVV